MVELRQAAALDLSILLENPRTLVKSTHHPRMEILQKKTPNFVNINFTKDSLNFDKIDAHSIDDNFMKKKYPEFG